MTTPKNVPAVDVDLFEKAFAPWYASIDASSPEDRDTAGIGTMLRMFYDEPEVGMIVTRRMLMLDELIHANKTRILKWNGFPSSWVQTAATMPPLYGKWKFDASLFTWPTGEDRKAFEAEAAQGKS